MARSLLVMMLALACTSSAETDVTDTDTDRDTGDTSEPDVRWTVAQVSPLPLGEGIRLRGTPTGGLVAVAFETVGTTVGTCSDGGSKVATPLHVLSWQAQQWTDRVIAEPIAPFGPVGAGLAVDPQGEAWVSWADGEALDTWCGGHNAVLGVPDGGDGWTVEVAAAESNDALTGQPASDAGSVVGLWTDVAFDADGNPAVVYRDAHFGALQSDDRNRSDQELAWKRGGRWQHSSVDTGDGAGDHNRLVFDAQGRPVLATVLPIIKQGEDRQGVWVARQTESGFERVQLVSGEVDDDLVLRAFPDGSLALAVYVPADASAVLYRYTGGDFSSWERTWLGRDGWVEGEDVDLDQLSDGRLVAAWHTCGRLGGDEATCDRDEEGPSLAIEGPDGWTVERLHRQGDGACGRELSLAVVDDVPHVVFRCVIEQDGTYVERMLHAVREAAL